MAANIGQVKLHKRGGWRIVGLQVHDAIADMSYPTREAAEQALRDINKAKRERQTTFLDRGEDDLPGQGLLF